MMYWYSSGMSGWGYALMTVSMILFWSAVIFGIVMLVRYFGRSCQPPAEPRSPQSLESPRPPERLLAERFARDEIDEEEYQRRLAVLQGKVSPPTARLARPQEQAPSDRHR